MTPKSKLFYGSGSIILASFFYGFYGILVRIIGFSLPLFYQSWTRSLLSSLVLLICIIIFRSWKKIERKDIRWIIARTGAGFIAYTLSFIAFNFIPISTAYFNFYAGSSIGGYILAALLFHERFTPVKVFSLMLALGGLSFIYTLDIAGTSIFYMSLAIFSGVGNAVWTTFSKKISGTYSSLQLNFLDMALFSVFCFLVSLLLRETWSMPEISAPWIANILFGLMFLAAGQLIILGFKYLEAQIATLLMLLEIVFGIIFSFIYFKEIASLASWVGGSCIILAIVLSEIKWEKLRFYKKK